MAVQQEPVSIAVERTLAVLEAVAERSAGMSNADVHRRLKIPKSSASYILRTLVKGGYLRRDRESGRYHLGLKVVGLSHRALAGLDIREIAHSVLKQLVDATQLTAHLAILDNDQAVYIEKLDGPGFVKMNTWVGRRLDVHSTSVGKILISQLDDEAIEGLVERRGLSKRTPQTLATIARLLRDLDKVRELGFAVDDEENSPGVRCVAAPVFNSEGGIEAAIGVSGTTYQFERGGIPKMADLVKAAARKISHQLGASRR